MLRDQRNDMRKLQRHRFVNHVAAIGAMIVG
jgi:hypothetical protein